MSAYRWGVFAAAAAGAFAVACQGAIAVEPGAPARLIDREFVTLIAVRKELQNPEAAELFAAKDKLDGLRGYYEAEDARLVWVDGSGLKQDAVSGLRKAFQRADSFGLHSGDYALPPAAANEAAEELALAELRYSLAAITYADHAQTGRFPANTLNEKFIDVKPAHPDPAELLGGLAASGDGLTERLESYHPPHDQFKALRKKLLEVRNAAKSGKVRTRIPDGPSLGPDTYHPHIAIVRERLGVEPPENTGRQDPSQYYDVELEAAIRGFQQDKGLKPDGIIGRNTREALNEGTIPVSAETIIANMERWRWKPRDFGKRHVFINIPEFKFRLISSGRIIHQERIVAGSPKHRTPIFSDEMETIVFNPYWNVPRSIMVNEIIPAVRNNPAYIYRNNLEVIWNGRRTVEPYLVDWHQVDPNKLFLRQTPGPGNALGKVKFLFPNKHAVYMHDTPTKHLFNRPVRAYSHGCMRVRDPLKFAELLLEDQGWSRSRIDQTLYTAHDQHVKLESKLPVHISYFTAWVDDDGVIHGYQDVYGYDAEVRLALNLDTNRRYAASSEEEFEVGERGLQN